MSLQNLKPRVILDSGAFSAWTKRVDINLDDYIGFIKANRNKYYKAVALDVIPGQPGVPVTQKEKDKAAKQSWENYTYMLRKGIPVERIIPVFHQGEDFKWLEKMIKISPYIGVSPANDQSLDSRVRWLKSCRPLLVDSNGKATVRYHGFAVTAFRMLETLPWFSVDSVTWKRCSGLGNIIIPTPLYTKDITQGYVQWEISSKEKRVLQKTKGLFDVKPLKKYDILPPKRRQMIDEYIEDTGYDLNTLRDCSTSRMYFNIDAYHQITEALGIRIHYAGITKSFLPAFIERKIPFLLVSYHYLTKDFLGYIMREYRKERLRMKGAA